VCSVVQGAECRVPPSDRRWPMYLLCLRVPLRGRAVDFEMAMAAVAEPRVQSPESRVQIPEPRGPSRDMTWLPDGGVVYMVGFRIRERQR
jgi:hypothetical protein